MGRKKKKNPSSKSKDECMKKRKNSNITVRSDVYHISEDLIIEILLRLPPTSVIRFKCVCKTWCSLITNPDFLRTHYSSLSLQFHKHNITTTDDEELMASSYNTRALGLPLQHQSNQLQKLFPQSTTPSKFYKELLTSFYAIDACNGLILLCRRDSERSSSYSYYVCNPIMKHLLKIPSNRLTEKFYALDDPAPCILFDPSISLSYKLIKCFTRMDKNSGILYEFFVYSSETGSWRHLISFPSRRPRLMGGNTNTAVLLNGIFYWKKRYNGDRLVCFDLKEENVWFLPLPPNPIGYSERMCFYFGECDGRLRLIEKYFVFERQTTSHLTIPCSFDIMETEPQQQQQDGNLTWSVKYHVNITTGYAENRLFTFNIIQLYKTKKNEGEEEALLLNIYGRIVPFNLKNNTFGKELRIQNTFIFDQFSDFRKVFPYITTTLLPLL